MSVLIKEMEMPRKCFNCLMCDRDAFRRWFCVATLDEIPTEQLNTVQENCPLVEIPMPHGALIDRDKLTGEQYKEGHLMVVEMDAIEDAPTIIEAEE